MSNPKTTDSSNATGPSSDGADSASQDAQRPTSTLTSFTDLLGLDENSGTVCTPDGYCS